ncbi:hypothetical protein CO641_02265 [Lysobacteraceae bacterium NML91-0213]|nr:hypothetical protein CO641_02265 [Xanthomonadaceae bacterium NML91-0213]
MGKICVRCGYERQDTDTAPAGECPRCGVIYARVEGVAGPDAATVRSARAALRYRQAGEIDGAGFTAFRTMYTPFLVHVAFLLAVVGSVAGAILAIMQEAYLLAVGCLVWLVAARLALEGIAIVFRIANDLSAVRKLLAEQALHSARQAARTSD